MNEAAIEMPKYRCHKEVWALKIASVWRQDDGTGRIYPVERGYAPIEVNGVFMRKHEPKIGMYYVVYEDGYASVSPAEAFERGYVRIS